MSVFEQYYCSSVIDVLKLKVSIKLYSWKVTYDLQFAMYSYTAMSTNSPFMNGEFWVIQGHVRDHRIYFKRTHFKKCKWQ